MYECPWLTQIGYGEGGTFHTAKRIAARRAVRTVSRAHALGQAARNISHVWYLTPAAAAAALAE